jgi:diguanylate cyclase (GGDEF)-like protein
MRHALDREASLTARRIVVCAILGSLAILVAAFLVMHSLQLAHRSVVENARRLSDLGGAIRLADEQLAMSANLAVSTGEARWIKRYEELLPVIDAAIASASTMVSETARKDIETSDANEQLVALERQSMEMALAGDRVGAQAILDGPEYARHKARLVKGIEDLLKGLKVSSALELERVQAGRNLMLLGLMAVALVGFLTLWRRLLRLMKGWESLFVAQESALHRLAVNDTLTGLPNRRDLTERLHAEVAKALQGGPAIALLLLNIDRFKTINERHGHEIGDLVLVEIGTRLRRLIQSGEIVARLGGDEFVVVVKVREGRAQPASIAQRIIEELARPITVGSLTVDLRTSVGFATCPADATDAPELLRRADVALYRAKTTGRGTSRSFDAMMDAELRERVVLEGDLKKAIAAGQIIPFFQPLVRLATGRIVGFEILARWQHPACGMISPAKFVPISEDLGLVSDMTYSVLHQACMAARDWPGEPKIAMNIAPIQLRDTLLPTRLLGVLKETGFPPRRLEIEITENALIEDLEVAKRILQALKAVGVSVALDDFGVGYASLSQLSALAFDKIKIDRSFIQTMQEKPASLTIVHAIVSLGRSLGMPTLAEGIESLEVAEALKSIGCTDGQGYLYSLPVPASEVPHLLARADRRVAA